MFAVAAFIMLALWAWSLVPPIESWGNPNEDGFSYVPVFYTTIICLPVGIYLLVGAIAGHGQYVRRARIAFFIAAGITLLVVAFLVFQQIANNKDGKVFGIQIGFQIDHRDADSHTMSALPPIADIAKRLYIAGNTGENCQIGCRLSGQSRNNRQRPTPRSRAVPERNRHDCVRHLDQTQS
jgi:zinc transporter ZupT